MLDDTQDEIVTAYSFSGGYYNKFTLVLPKLHCRNKYKV